MGVRVGAVQGPVPVADDPSPSFDVYILLYNLRSLHGQFIHVTALF